MTDVSLLYGVNNIFTFCAYVYVRKKLITQNIFYTNTLRPRNPAIFLCRIPQQTRYRVLPDTEISALRPRYTVKLNIRRFFSFRYPTGGSKCSKTFIASSLNTVLGLRWRQKKKKNVPTYFINIMEIKKFKREKSLNSNLILKKWFGMNPPLTRIFLELWVNFKAMHYLLETFCIRKY